MRRPTLAVLLASSLTAVTAIAASATSMGATNTAAAATAQPPIGHVWTIMLENSEFEQTFLGDRNSAPYLTQTLPSLGKLVVQYYGTGHSSADNYVAMASGQGPNPSTQGDCDTNTTLGNPAGAGGGSVEPSATTWEFDADGQAVDKSGASTIFESGWLVTESIETSSAAAYGRNQVRT